MFKFFRNLQNTVTNLELKVEKLTRENEELKASLDSGYLLENLTDEVKDLERKIDDYDFEDRVSGLEDKIEDLNFEDKIESLEETTSDFSDRLDDFDDEIAKLKKIIKELNDKLNSTEQKL